MKSILHSAGRWVLGVLVLASAVFPVAPSSAETDGIRVFVVRHGEAYTNLPQSQQPTDRDPDGLTAKGKKQAAEAATSLRDSGVTHVYSSPAGRTRETAEIIHKQLDLEGSVFLHPGFRPMESGVLPDGQEVPWMWREEQWANGNDPAPVEGESLEQATTRALAVVREIADASPNAVLLISTHSDIWAGLAAAAQQTPWSQAYQKHKPGYCETIELRVTPEQVIALKEPE